MKIGDYVRSSWGTISKIIEYTPYEDDECFGITLEDETNTFYKHQWQFDNDYKVSSNIIDLIEVGDYVNGMQVTRICFDEDGERILNLSNCILELMNDDIKSIVTKEMFEEMEYRIGE